jgi:beta-lactamase class A
VTISASRTGPRPVLFFFLTLSLFADDRLQNEIARLAKITDGQVGLTAIHIETNRHIAFHESDRFPMASAFKVPIAVQILSRVDRGNRSGTDHSKRHDEGVGMADSGGFRQWSPSLVLH